MDDPLIPLDLARMFVGDSPALYFVEIAARTLIIYGYMFLLMRVLGRRSKSGLSILDVLVILALGSAVGDGNFYPQVPILHCLLVVTIIVGVNKGIVVAADHNPRLREMVEGKPRVVVRDGIVLTEELARTGIGLHDLLELLRLKGICNLGQIDLVILEPSCDLSVYRRNTPVPGLSILPIAAEDPTEPDATLCCEGCGVARPHCDTPCPHEGLSLIHI